jgi:hypothetical protein
MRQRNVDPSSSSVMSVKSFGEEEFFLIAMVATFLVSSSLELSSCESHS